MSLLSRLTGGEEQRAFTGWPWDSGGPPPYMAVGVERAVSLIPVWGAARVLGQNIASLTPALYTVGADGVWNKQPTPSLFINPSVNGTLFDWLERGTHSLALWGDAIGYVTARNYYGYPTMVEWLNPDQVSCMDGSSGQGTYSSNSSGSYTSDTTGKGSFMDPIWYWRGRKIDNREDIVHMPFFTQPYKIRGLSPISAFQTVANVGLGAQDYASAWFLNGGVPPAVVKNVEQKVSHEDADIITARITNRLQQRKPLVIGKDWDFTPIGIKPNDAMFVETAKLTANHISVIYGVPAEMIGGETGGSLTYNTVNSNALNFLTFSLRPWLVRWEQTLSNLFPRGYFVKFVTDDLLRMDQLTKAQVDQTYLGYYPPASRTINEVRRSSDLPPVDGGDVLVPPYRPGMGGGPDDSGDQSDASPPQSAPEPPAVDPTASESAPEEPQGTRAKPPLSGRLALMKLMANPPHTQAHAVSRNGHNPFAPTN